MHKLILLIFVILFLVACTAKKTKYIKDFVIASGQMPNIAKDDKGIIHLVFGSGDSLLYSFSNSIGNSFSTPSLIAVIPQLAASHTRGPQITSSNGNLIIITCNDAGNIFSYHKQGTKSWEISGKVNDTDTTAKENFIALSANKQFAFAIWLDVRENGKNKIYGSKSIDGGKTWQKNIMIYTSPDSTVCECCKPSILLVDNIITVMFRNWVNGNRDMYIIQSTNGGNTFKTAQKLGNNSWKINGCPMDGGAFAINKSGKINTVWRREDKIFTALPGMPEKQIGEGKACTIETINDKNIYAWKEKNDIIILRPDGIKIVTGKGNTPILKALDDKNILCIWESDHQIRGSVIAM